MNLGSGLLWPGGERVAMKVTPAIALFSIGGTLAYLGLAIFGKGGFAAFFGNPALAALALILLVLVVVALFTQGNLSSGEREDRGNRWVLIAFGLLSVAAGYLPAYIDRIDFWTFDGQTLRWIGVALFALGGGLMLWPVFVLGRRFSGLVAIQPGHRLVTTGIYRVIRNPSYLGMLITALGWALAFRSGVGVLLTLLLLPPLVVRIRAEEAMLRSQFGAEYDAYFDRTWRLVPGIY